MFLCFFYFSLGFSCFCSRMWLNMQSPKTDSVSTWPPKTGGALFYRESLQGASSCSRRRWDSDRWRSKWHCCVGLWVDHLSEASDRAVSVWKTRTKWTKKERDPFGREKVRVCLDLLLDLIRTFGIQPVERSPSTSSLTAVIIPGTPQVFTTHVPDISCGGPQKHSK